MCRAGSRRYWRFRRSVSASPPPRCQPRRPRNRGHAPPYFLAASGAASVAALAAPPSPTAAQHDLIQVLLPGTSPAVTGQAPGIDELRERARSVRRMFCTCDYAELEQTLPGLIADLRQAAGGSSGSPEASGVLATAYQTSVSLLLKRADQGNSCGGCQVASDRPR